MRRRRFLGACGWGLAGLAAATSARAEEVHDDFQVVIAGGSTAAFAAAVAAAESGVKTALIEPTDWVGGQLTASGVPAIDEAWHKITDPKTGALLLNVAALARARENMTPNFRAMLDATGNPGHGWVSNYCFQPKDFLDRHLLPLERSLTRKGTLTVFRESVVKRVETDPVNGVVTGLVAVHRAARPGVAWGGYDRLLSRDLADWYSPEPSDRFDKTIIRFVGRGGRNVVFIDATEWGEVLVLADAPYLQGVETVDGGREGNDLCGQSTVFDLVERLNAGPIVEPEGPKDVPALGFGDYTDRADAWSQIWTYRRIKSNPAGGPPAVGDLCLQNWGYSGKRAQGGNDYPFGYLFRRRSATRAERADWRGGVDLGVIAEAERRALAWHAWFKNHPPEGIAPGQVSLEIGALGTGHGLAKLPYVRDTRRSVGLDGFLLTAADLTGPAGSKTGRRFPDRVALGAYPADVHPLTSCPMPAYIGGAHATLPFLIPFRALTNERFGNLLVAGKTMAQSFLANAATRLHPIEWATGTAAGVAAADMARLGCSSRDELGRIERLQALVRAKTPIDWTIDGKIDPGAAAGH